MEILATQRGSFLNLQGGSVNTPPQYSYFVYVEKALYPNSVTLGERTLAGYRYDALETTFDWASNTITNGTLGTMVVDNGVNDATIGNYINALPATGWFMSVTSAEYTDFFNSLDG